MSSQDKAADSPASTGKTGDVVFKTIAYAAGILILVALAAVFLFLLFQAWPLIGGDQAANTATIESFTGNRAHNFWQYVGPLVFGTVPFYTRQVEVALAGVNEGKVEAARSMGSGTLGLIFRVYLHEAVPELIRVTTDRKSVV